MSGADETLPDPLDPTVVDEPDASWAALDLQLVEEAIRSGFITRPQADLLLESVAARPADAGPEGTVQLMVARGLISRDVGDQLWAGFQQGFVPGYRLLGELGRGAMGVVYRAEQVKLKRQVALKVVNPKLSAEPSYVRRFKQEALALARLNHPNIVQVYDYGEAEGTIYLALEFVEGTDCAQLIKAEGRLDPARAFKVVLDAAVGLSHAQQAGVIHRDVKPANLLIVEGAAADARGATLTVKVTDLGLARQTQPDGRQGDMTAAGTILGTPAYMAPEQAEGGAADHRCDIYALGATLYHLLTGELPYRDSSVLNMLLKKRTEPLEDPRALVRGLSDDVVRVLDAMLARDPAQRYQGYAELIADLERLLRGEAIRREPVPRATSSLDLAGDDPVGSSAAAPPERGQVEPGQVEPGQAEPGQAEPGAQAEPGPAPNPVEATGGRPRARSRAGWLLVGAAIVGAAVWAVTDGRAPGAAADGGQGQAGEAPAGPPAERDAATRAERLAGVEGTLAALEALAPADLLQQTEALSDLRAQVRALPAEAQGALKVRLGALVRGALSETEDGVQERLEALYREGDYPRLAEAAARALAPYALFERAPPGRVEALQRLAASALQGEAGQREREVWRALQAAARDPLQVIALGEGFAERFPFSPVREEVTRRVAAAAEQAPQVRLRVEPAAATVAVDGGAPRPGGAWTGRLLRGPHRVRAQAEGHFPLDLPLQVSEPLQRTLRLGPRPARALVPNTGRGAPVWRPRRFVRDWTRVGSWSVVLEVAGVNGEGEGAAARRPLGPLLRFLQGAPGWTLSWELARPADCAAGTPFDAEARLFVQPERTLVVARQGGRLVLGVRGPGGLDVRAQRAAGDAGPATQHAIRLDWDGAVAVVRVDGEVLGSIATGWGEEPPVLELVVTAGRAQFRNLSLLALKPAD